MKKVALIPNTSRDRGLAVSRSVSELLASLGIIVYAEREVCAGIPSAIPVGRLTELPNDVELVIVVGGDGSMIDASFVAISRDIPIIGVNLGKVGYLSEVDPDNISVLSRLASGEYTVEEKMLLTVSGSEGRLAVNDIVISHESYLGIGDFRVEAVAGDALHYRADAVVFSTPQGSTAYSLSAGGPIVSHDVDTIVLSPVAPHSLFNRSVLFGADNKIRVTNLGDEEINVSVDGRFSHKLAGGESCEISRAEKRIKMLTFTENSMFSSFFKKMRILEDIR
ncbi:MAG: NAD(+)/NADH kinase [Clostridia bacterium]|nr:NAD(+)/NADH kinase [Clostridia bacterium]